MYSEEELEHLDRTAMPSKSAFSKKKFDNVKEWKKNFL